MLHTSLALKMMLDLVVKLISGYGHFWEIGF